MKKLLKTLFVMIVVGLVVAGVASYMSKKRLEAKSDDEIREFLAKKLDGKVGEEQLATIQDAVIGGIRGKSASDDVTSEDASAGESEEAPSEDGDSEEDDVVEEPSDDETTSAE
jgi:hypothetical protein